MCGICGVVNSEGQLNESLLLKMRDSLTHRGPDDSGIYIDGTRRVGLGHRRLSIIDLSPQGRQPLSNEDNSIQIVFNGEFYSFNEARTWLEARGHRFKSQTDTETIVHLYEEKGLDFVQDLRDMFALALWDENREQLVLARDRVGKKPVYYSVGNDKFAFASEIKSLLRVPWISREVDLDALNYYFTLGYIPWTMSIFREIRKLPPAHLMIYHVPSGKMSIRRYWDLPENEDALTGASEDALLQELEARLRESVQLRLVSDVPLGVFLSGGLDSSIVASLMAHLSPSPIKTFSIGFDEDQYNELSYARQVAEHLETEHHEFIVRPDALEMISRLPEQYDEPFADSSAIPTYYVSKMTRDGVKVALAGDGGDELFGGYNWYRWVQQGTKLSRTLGPVSRLLGGIGNHLPPWVEGKHYLERLALDAAGQFLKRVSAFPASERARLLNSDVRAQIKLEGPEREVFASFNGHSGDLLSQMSRLDFQLYLPDDILVKVDRASMSVSLEVRAPLLDHKLCEFAFRLPSYLKQQGKTRKYLLKRLAQKFLPSGFPLERKQGFSIPLREWFRDEPLNSLFRDAICHEAAAQFVNRDTALTYLQEHQQRGVDHSFKLWTVLMFGLWAQRHL